MGSEASKQRRDGGGGNGDGAASASADVKDELEAVTDEHGLQDEMLYVRTGLSRSGGVAVTVDDFDLLKVVGKGSFGKVFLARKRTGPDANSVYALKALRKEVLHRRDQVEHTRSERAILEAVNHPFIVTLRYAFQTRDKLYIVTDFAPGGELFFWLKRDCVFSQARARLYAAELVLALGHLHSLDIVYRDLKPENILLDADGHIKLTDFGLSKMEVTGPGPDGGGKTFCGTPEYLAPEILENAGHGKAVDWWSLGTLLFEMMAGLPPFYDTNIELMYEKIMTADLRFPRHFLPETRSLLTGMLTRRVEDRLGYGGVEELKAHPFFSGLDWDDVYARRYRPEFIPPPNGVAVVPTEALTEAQAAAAAEGGGLTGPFELVPVVTNFEEEFTRESPVDSVADPSKLSGTAEARGGHFSGFTFVPPDGAGALGRSG